MVLNIAHSEFPEQQGGLMICGYEWGGGEEEGEGVSEPQIDWSANCTFANKDLRYGPAALGWRYDNRIKKWFDMWGCPLNHADPGGFEKSIIQTNWCDTQNPQMNGDYSRLSEPEQVKNFLNLIKRFSPNLILFMGSKLIDALHNPSTFKQFQEISGKCTRPINFVQKNYDGRKFKVGFEKFEWCDVVCFPHPSSSHGLSDEYISLFNDDMKERIADYKLARMYMRQFPGARYSSALRPNSRREDN